jgi:hypothetical protein
MKKRRSWSKILYENNISRKENEYMEETALKWSNISDAEKKELIAHLTSNLKTLRAKGGLSTLFQTNFFRLFFRYCTGV